MRVDAVFLEMVGSKDSLGSRRKAHPVRMIANKKIYAFNVELFLISSKNVLKPFDETAAVLRAICGWFCALDK